ncbi:MAG: DinB family protein [Nitrososphaerales archaeon]
MSAEKHFRSLHSASEELSNDIPNPRYYRRLFGYNRRILRAYFAALAKLPWKTVSKNMEASHHSIKNIFIHILTVHNGWLNYNVYGKSSEIPHETEHDPDTYRSMKEINSFMNKVMSGEERLLENLDEGMLLKKVKAPWLPGTHKLADVLMQVSIEQAHHIGEIIALFWQLDVEPPEMTWIMNTRKLK